MLASVSGAYAAPGDSARIISVRDREPTTWDIEIAPRDESGSRFVMSGRVIGLDSQPLTGAKLYVYHADGQGYYARKGEERLGNRIAGVLRTNARGEYRVRSILPGQYAGAPHVHFEVWADRIARRTIAVNLYPDSGAALQPGWKHTPWTPRQYTDRMAVVSLDSSGVYQSRYDLKLSAAVIVPPPGEAAARATSGWPSGYVFGDSSFMRDTLYRAIRERLDRTHR